MERLSELTARPGGSLLSMNEPLRWPTDLKRDHAVEVAQVHGPDQIAA
jgi:hypothetical protein